MKKKPFPKVENFYDALQLAECWLKPERCPEYEPRDMNQIVDAMGRYPGRHWCAEFWDKETLHKSNRYLKNRIPNGKLFSLTFYYGFIPWFVCMLVGEGDIMNYLFMCWGLHLTFIDGEGNKAEEYVVNHATVSLVSVVLIQILTRIGWL